MKKITFLIIVAVISTLLMLGCIAKNRPTEPSDIHVSIDEKIVTSMMTLTKWDGTVYEKTDQLKTFINNRSGSEIPYFEIGKSVEIFFDNYPPDKLSITDTLFNENGGQLYTDKEIYSIPVEYKNGMVKFEIPMHPASGLSSLAVEGKRDIQGYRILASWGENECEYVFVIKTASAGTVVEVTELLTIEDVKKLSKKGDNLSWGDFAAYFGSDTGSGLYIMEYPIDDKYSVHIGGGSKDEKPMYIQLISVDSTYVKHGIDIRHEDVEKFLKESQ